MSHTPGPWEWDAGDAGQDYSAPYCTVSKDGGELIIAEVNDRFSQDEGRANARLIAAAPETAAERDRLQCELFAIRDVIPIGILQLHDVPGATGPTDKLNIAGAVKATTDQGRKLTADRDRLLAVNAKLLDALKDAREYFDQRADAEYFPDKAAPVGNEEMGLFITVDAAIKSAEASHA